MILSLFTLLYKNGQYMILFMIIKRDNCFNIFILCYIIFFFE